MNPPRGALSLPLLGVFVAPVLFLVHQAAAPGEFAALARMTQTVLADHLRNTALAAAVAAGLAALMGAGGAYLVTFFRFPARGLLGAALALPLVLPPYFVAMAYRELAHLHPLLPAPDSALALGLILALTLYPYVYLLARAAFASLPAAYAEAGHTLGLDWRRVTTRVLLPLALPGVLLGALLVMVETVSDFGTANVLGVRTLTTAVHRAWFTLFDPALAAQLALASALLPLLGVAGYALATAGRGFATLSNRPRAPSRRPLSAPAGRVAAALCALPVLLGFAVPMVVLLGWAAEAFATFRLQSLFSDLLRTLALAGGTTLLAVLAGLGLALTGRARGGRPWALGGLAVVSLVYGLPAAALAIALLSLTGWSYDALLGSWLADSMALVLLAATLRFTAFTYFAAESGLRGVSPRLDEALRCAGRGPLYGLFRVALPLIRVPLLVGALLVFVITAKELTLSLVLQPFGYGSLALSVYRFASLDLFGPAALYALCLALVVVYPVLSVNRWVGGGR